MRALFTVGSLLGLAALLESGLQASQIYAGSLGSAPIQILSTAGDPLGTLGDANDSAAAVGVDGTTFIVTPGDTSSTISAYQNHIFENSFTFTQGNANMLGFENYITDVALAGPNQLWLSAFNGWIYLVGTAGNAISSFDTGVANTGVASDGTFVYTTSGLGANSAAPFIYKRTSTGALVGIINTGLNDTLGLGADSDGTFWVGGIDVLTQVNGQGQILQTFSLDGLHSGVEVTPDALAAPEPATFALSAACLALIAAFRHRLARRVAGAAVAVSAAAFPAVSINSVNTSALQPQPVGTAVTISVDASDTAGGPLRYRFRIAKPHGALETNVDYGPNNSYSWIPLDKEGDYTIEVSALSRADGSVATTIQTYSITSRATSTPVVSATPHPLVALYSAPPCPAGASMRVRFKTPVDAYWQSTALKACDGATSMNFLVAGMYGNTAYSLRHDVLAGPRITSGPTLAFTTGTPESIPYLPTQKIPVPPPTSTTEPMAFYMPLFTSPFASDLNGNLLWYLPTSNPVTYGTRLAPGGDVFVIYGFSPDLPNSGFREFDLTGQFVRETNVERLNDQLSAMGKQPVNAIHHEVRRLPDGKLMMLAMVERNDTVQGAGVDVVGDAILVLDSNLQVVWYWNGFERLDVSKGPILGETCANGQGLCVLFLANTAVDWTHSNSLALAPDGNIILSIRHLDWVVKIAYENGAGDGHVIWRLGRDGDFAWNSTDPWPWFSHQHDATLEPGNVMRLFDNGNTRIAANGGNSRGMAVQLDENARTATPIISADLGAYSLALGSAERLSNGDFLYTSGWVNVQNLTETSQVNPSGAIVSQLSRTDRSYRGFRFRDLYSAPLF